MHSILVLGGRRDSLLRNEVKLPQSEAIMEAGGSLEFRVSRLSWCLAFMCVCGDFSSFI